MATGEYPDFNDRTYNLWKKAAFNVYSWAVERGITGLNAPNINDPQDILIKKLTYYTAALAESQ